MSTNIDKLERLKQIITIYKNSMKLFAKPEIIETLNQVLSIIETVKEKDISDEAMQIFASQSQMIGSALGAIANMFNVLSERGDKKKKLYEVTNGNYGESYIRCYVWTETESEAKKMARTQFENVLPKLSALNAIELFNEKEAPFATKPSDHGWER